MSSKITVTANVPLLRDVAQRLSDFEASLVEQVRDAYGFNGTELVWVSPYELESIRKAQQILNTLVAAAGNEDGN